MSSASKIFHCSAEDSSRAQELDHDACMDLALDLAQKAHVGDTLPNPRVGAVVVKNGRIISTGYHKARGTLHAERDALKKLSYSEAKGATLYCTLEPCCTTWEGKKQPPCTEAILHYGIRRVYIASTDPNPKVRGRGIALLRKHNVMVAELSKYTQVENTMNEAVHALYASAKLVGETRTYARPFVHAKIAQSLDARVAAQDGSSVWITNYAARKEVHRMRRDTQILCTGLGTVLKDDPHYSVRHVQGASPALAIFDSALQTPPSARLFQTQRRAPGLVVCTTERGYENKTARKALEGAGAHILCLKPTDKDMLRVPLVEALRHFIELGVYSLMLEAGATLTNAFLNLGLIDKVSCFIAPLFLGGGEPSQRYTIGTRDAPQSMDQARRLMYVSASVLEGDESECPNCLLSGYVHDIFSHS